MCSVQKLIRLVGIIKSLPLSVLVAHGLLYISQSRPGPKKSTILFMFLIILKNLLFKNYNFMYLACLCVEYHKMKKNTNNS